MTSDASDVFANANRAIAEADRLLSIASSVRWLAVHGINVHQNTVRHWVKSGRVQAVRREKAPCRNGRRPEILIPLDTLAKMAACPFCSAR